MRVLLEQRKFLEETNLKHRQNPTETMLQREIKSLIKFGVPSAP